MSYGPAVNVKSPEWRHCARAILTSKETPVVLFEFQLDLIPEDCQKKFEVLRADAIAFDPWQIKNGKGHIRILELKSGRADFKSDKKWERYLPYCNQFAFLAPGDCIKPDELGDGVGLFVPSLYTHSYFDPMKQEQVVKEKTEPVKVKEWRIRRVITPERREAIKKRLVNRGIAALAAEHIRLERLYYDNDPALLKALATYDV